MCRKTALDGKMMAKISAYFKACRQEVSIYIQGFRAIILHSAVMISRVVNAAGNLIKKVSIELSCKSGFPYYRHYLPIRVMHWSNVVFVTILLMSGLNILEAHPAFYWGISSYQGAPPVLKIMGTFPSWMTIPGHRWLAMARRWHFFFAWLLLMNGVVFVIYSILSRHLLNDLVPTKQDWRSIGNSIIDHLLLRHPTGAEAKRYNILQKLAYLGVIFLLFPFMILMGLGMSPTLDALSPGWVDIFFGRQSIRTIHFVIACALLLFVIIHVFEVIVTGFWNNLRSMITGYYRIKSEADHES